MNRGTAFKWIEMLESGIYTLCNIQTCFRMTNADGTISYDHVGVLCELLDPNGWKINDEVDYAHRWHGEHHYVKAQEDLRRGKIKHQEFIFVDEFDKQHSFADMTFDEKYRAYMNRNEPHHITDIIRKYYEQF